MVGTRSAKRSLPKTKEPPKKKKKNENAEIAPKLDDSSSESDIEDYLQPVDKLDLNSSFFQIEKPEKSVTPEKNRISRLTDTESDESEHKEEPETKLNFDKLQEYTRKLEETKKHIEEYNRKKQEESSKTDILNLLAKGEAKIEPNELENYDFHSSDFQSCSDSEKEWEEVKMKVKEPIVPKEGLQITVEMPNAIKKKKGVDLMAAMKRRLNRIRKDNQIYVHKVHLLCWIAHGNYVNSVLNSEKIIGLSLSLLPSEKCYPSERTDLKYLEQILQWYKKTIKLTVKPEPKDISLENLLQLQINQKEVYNKKMLILIFISILRSLGIHARLVMSLQVEPLRPPNSDLLSLSTKAAKKETKAKSNSKTKAKKAHVNTKNEVNEEKVRSESKAENKNKTKKKVLKDETISIKTNATKRGGEEKSKSVTNQNLIENKTETKTNSKMKKELLKEEAKLTEMKKTRLKSDSQVTKENERKRVVSQEVVENGVEGRKLRLRSLGAQITASHKTEIETNSKEKKKTLKEAKATETKKARLKSDSQINVAKENNRKSVVNQEVFENKPERRKLRLKSLGAQITESEEVKKDVEVQGRKLRFKSLGGSEKKVTNTKLPKAIKNVTNFKDTQKISKNTRSKSTSDNLKLKETKKRSKSTGDAKIKIKLKPMPKKKKEDIPQIDGTHLSITDIEDSDVSSDSGESSADESSNSSDSNDSGDYSDSYNSSDLYSLSDLDKPDSPKSSDDSDLSDFSSDSDIIQLDGGNTKKKSKSPKKIDDDFEPKTEIISKRNTPSTSKYFPKNSPTDVRNDIIQIMKRRIAEEKRANTESNGETDSDSDYLPEESPKKKRRDSADEFLPKTKVKQRVQIRKSDTKRKVLSSDSETETTGKGKKKGNDVWVEVFLETEEKWISVDVYNAQVHCVNELYKRASHPVCYVIGWNNDNTLKDITKRYCQNFNTTTRKLRVDENWWQDTLKSFLGPNNARNKEEDDEFERQQIERPLPTSIAEYKNHPLYVLKRHLLKFEAIYPPDAPTLGFIRNEAVYSRQCVYVCHSRDIWLKHAKVVKLGEKPYKIVKARPKYDKLSNTVVSDQMLEIFGTWQTEDYVPSTAENGIVPRNAFGNVELFKSCMLPKKTVHLQLPGLNKIAKRMNIDCASAIVGFDFHGGYSHPTYDGFVVCAEYEDQLVAAWELEQEEIVKRQQEKTEKRVYDNWRLLIKGLLIRERLKAKYNFGNNDKSGKTKKNKQARLPTKKRRIISDSESEAD